MGVNPLVKDILVQVDWSKDAANVDPFGTRTQRLILSGALARIGAAFDRAYSAQSRQKERMNIIFDYGQTAFQFKKGGNVVEYQPDWCTQREIPEPCCNQDANRRCTKVWSTCVAANCPPGTPGVCCPAGVTGNCINLFRTGYSPGVRYCVETAVPVPGVLDKTVNCTAGSCELYDAVQPQNNVVPNYDPHHPYNENELMTGGSTERYLLSPERRHIFREVFVTNLNSGYASGGNRIPADTANPGTDLYFPTGFVAVPTGVAYDPGPLAAYTMHELGHTLSLDHGGDDRIFYKPNYVSVMNYSFCNRPVNRHGWVDYSSGQRPSIRMAQSIVCAVGAANCTQLNCLNWNPTNWWDAAVGCVVPGLNEVIGIGNLYQYYGESASQQELVDDATYVVGEVSTCFPTGLVYLLPGFVQPVPNHVNWDGDNVLDLGLVFADLWQPNNFFCTRVRPGLTDLVNDHDDWDVVNNKALPKNTGMHAFMNNGLWPCDAFTQCVLGTCVQGKCWLPVGPPPPPPGDYPYPIPAEPIENVECLGAN